MKDKLFDMFGEKKLKRKKLNILLMKSKKLEEK